MEASALARDGNVTGTGVGASGGAGPREPVPLRVLLVSYYFPPDLAVGGLRAERVRRMLTSAGHSVTVLAGPHELETNAAGDPDVLRLAPWFDLRGWYARWKSGRGASGDDALPLADTGTSRAPAARRTPLWKRLLLSLMWLPDDRQGWIPAVVRRGLAVARGGVDVLYTTGPPFSSHLAGLALKRLTGVPWVIEYRDPWTDILTPRADWRLPRIDAFIRRLELGCLQRADLCVAVTEGIAAGLLAKLPAAAADRVLVVRNGIGSLAPLPGGDGARPIRSVLYLGSFYHTRDPRPFLRAVAAVRRSRGLPDGFSIRFVGWCETYRDVDVRAFAEAEGIDDLLSLDPFVPRSAVDGFLDEADCLLLLARNQPSQVPNKAYDYLGTRKPILAFVDGDGETARLLREAGGHHLVTGDDPAEVERAVAAAVLGGTRAASTNEEAVQELLADRQLERLRQALEGVAASARPFQGRASVR